MRTRISWRVPAILAATLFAGMALAGNTRELNRTIPTDPGQKIDIRGFSGSSIRITAWEKPEVSIHLEFTFGGHDGAAELALQDSIRIDAERSGNGLLITLFDPGSSEGGRKTFWDEIKSFFGGNRSTSREITGEIRVPATQELSVQIPYSNIQIEGVKGKLNVRGTSNTVELRGCAAVEQVQNNYGKTKILASGGSLRLETQSGTVEIDEFNGKATCEAPYSTIRMNRIAGEVSLDGQSATINIAGVGGNLTVDANYSPITIADVAGTADVSAQSSTLRIRNVDGARVRANYSGIDISGVTGKSDRVLSIETQSGTLSIEDVVADLKADMPYSTMKMKAIRGNIRISGQSVQINAEGIDGNWDSDNQYSTISVKGLAARSIKAENSSGTLTFELTTVPADVAVKNKYSGVSITMPKGFGGTVSLDAEYGTIDSALPLAIKTRSGSAQGTGRIGTGNGSISIETTSGPIRLREK